MQHFIGRDVNTRNQVVESMDEETGEIRVRRLQHEVGKSGSFTRSFPAGR